MRVKYRHVRTRSVMFRSISICSLSSARSASKTGSDPFTHVYTTSMGRGEHLRTHKSRMTTKGSQRVRSQLPRSSNLYWKSQPDEKLKKAGQAGGLGGGASADGVGKWVEGISIASEAEQGPGSQAVLIGCATDVVVEVAELRLVPEEMRRNAMQGERREKGDGLECQFGLQPTSNSGLVCNNHEQTSACKSVGVAHCSLLQRSIVSPK